MIDNNNKLKLSLPVSFVDEAGSVLLITMMILVLLTLIGISGLNNTNIEIQIAGNDKAHDCAFYNADSGGYTTAKLISTAINEKATPFLDSTTGTFAASTFTYNDSGTSDTAAGHTFFRELSGFESYDTAPDVSFNNDGQHTIAVDVMRLRSVNIAGGGAEFASGMEGHGTSLSGVYFGINSTGSGPLNALSIISSTYLKVLGTAGGI